MAIQFRELISTITLMLMCSMISLLAHASVEIRDFSPQGKVRDPSRATAVFNGDIVKLGDTDAPAPFDIECSKPGTGRWSDPHTWTYSLSQVLDPGEGCKFEMKSGLKALDGTPVTGQTEYMIFTPGPWIQYIQPNQNARIEEDQVFIINVRIPVKPESVEAHAWCEVEGVGERIPVRVLSESEFNELMNNLHWGHSSNQMGIQCSRPLSPGAKIKLVWGQGIEGVNGASAKKATLFCRYFYSNQCPNENDKEDEIFKYQVRMPFRAELTCERERPNAPCSPMSDLRLEFSDRVERGLAEKILLLNKRGEQKPWDYSAERKTALLMLGQKVLVAKVSSGKEDNVDKVVFKGPFPPNVDFTITLPKGFKDLSGRPLSNATSFPLNTRVGALPPLVKFSAGFGILEQKEDGVLPVTLRNTESTLKMRVLRETDDTAMIKTWLALEQFEQQTSPLPTPIKPKMSRRTLEGEERTDPTATADVNYARELSYLASRHEATTQDLPKPGGTQPFEVVGIPLQKPGFYVVEIESKMLGASFFKSAKPMYVRSQALVTDMAVHFKKGRDNSLVWVTSLSTGKPVEGADISIYDCQGTSLWKAKTDVRGIALMDEPPANAYCFVTARMGEDFSFVRPDWTKGIEAWRFNVNSWNTIASPKIHTILDRTLLRAGETVSMKHIARVPQVHGFTYPTKEQLPKTMTIQLSGGDITVTLPLTWDARGVATSEWRIPDTAKLGTYSVQMDSSWQSTAEFRVSEFRLPKYKGSVVPEKPRFAHVSKIPLRLSLEYLNEIGRASCRERV